ncbi:MAG: glycosyltransferase [Bacteroidaceae bacterium]|nr:glycosyltransferase [Bacteroidaceae bacterium]
MHVLLVNTAEKAGGAAIAASRLTDALNLYGVKATLLVRDIQTSRITTTRVPHSGLQGLWLRWAFLWERACIWMTNRFRRQGLWEVDIANAGTDITRLPAFQQADIIHLHWVNQGFLSLHQIGKILQSGKPVVWTMHDMWPCTAICHHARACEHYYICCHDCPQLAAPSPHDLSWQVFQKKLHTYALGNLVFVGCSQWITEQARKSRLLQGHRVLSIPNTYDPRVFIPGDQTEARRHHLLPLQGRLLLFACQKVTNERKGFALLIEALNSPRLQAWRGQLSLVVVGQMAESVAAKIPFPIHALGYLHGDAEMAALYRAVDVFVTPSLEENLPNTIMESMACGTPCVGFDIGGIPEMIDHEANGYVARYRDASDLASGISFTLDPERHALLSQAAARKAHTSWKQETVARQYHELYESLLSTP